MRHAVATGLQARQLTERTRRRRRPHNSTGGSREPAHRVGPRSHRSSRSDHRAMIMSASPNIFGDELFNLSIDVVPRINRSLETGIFFWRRSFSGRASANGGLLPENRRQRLVRNPSRSMRLRDKLTPFFVWLYQRAFGKADCAAMCSSIVVAAEAKAVLWY